MQLSYLAHLVMIHKISAIPVFHIGNKSMESQTWFWRLWLPWEFSWWKHVIVPSNHSKRATWSTQAKREQFRPTQSISELAALPGFAFISIVIGNQMAQWAWFHGSFYWNLKNLVVGKNTNLVYVSKFDSYWHWELLGFGQNYLKGNKNWLLLYNISCDHY